MTAYIESFIIHYGLIAIFILMVTNGFFSAPPSETTLALGGSLVALLYHDFVDVFLVAIAGNIIGTYLLYLLARIFGHEWIFSLRKRLDNHDNKLLKLIGRILPDEFTYHFWAGKFMENNRKCVCLFRCFPVIRSIISIPAGVTKMHSFEFISFSIVGISIWALSWQLLGYYAIHSWQAYQWYISAPLLLFCVILIVALKKQYSNYMREKQDAEKTQQ